MPGSFDQYFEIKSRLSYLPSLSLSYISLNIISNVAHISGVASGFIVFLLHLHHITLKVSIKKIRDGRDKRTISQFLSQNNSQRGREYSDLSSLWNISNCYLLHLNIHQGWSITPATLHLTLKHYYLQSVFLSLSLCLPATASPCCYWIASPRHSSQSPPSPRWGNVKCCRKKIRFYILVQSS